MSVDEEKKKARAAVQAMFDRYKLLALQRPKGHTVSSLILKLGVCETDKWQDFDSAVMNNMKIMDAGPEGSVEFELFIAPNFSNLNSMFIQLLE